MSEFLSQQMFERYLYINFQEKKYRSSEKDYVH